MRAKVKNTAVRESRGITTEDFLSRLDKVRKTGKGWQAKCPAHEDKGPSLSISKGEKGTIVYCHAGCSFIEIVNSVGLTPPDLFYDSLTDDRRDEYRYKVLSNELFKLGITADIYQYDLIHKGLSDTEHEKYQALLGKLIETRNEANALKWKHNY